MNCHRCGHVIHIHRHRPEEVLFPFIQASLIQQKLILRIQARKRLANLPPCRLIIDFLYIGKAKKQHRICPLQLLEFLIFSYFEPLKQLFPVRTKLSMGLSH